MLEKFHTPETLLLTLFKLNRRLESAKERNLNMKEMEVEKTRESKNQQVLIKYVKHFLAFFQEKLAFCINPFIKLQHIAQSTLHSPIKQFEKS